MSRTKGWLALIFAVLLYAVPVALGAGVACTTVPKLITMAKIEGWIPGARRVVVRIAARWHSEFGRDTGYYEPRVTIALTLARTNDRQRRLATFLRSRMQEATASTCTDVEVSSPSQVISFSTDLTIAGSAARRIRESTAGPTIRRPALAAHGAGVVSWFGRYISGRSDLRVMV